MSENNINTKFAQSILGDEKIDPKGGGIVPAVDQDADAIRRRVNKHRIEELQKEMSDVGVLESMGAGIGEDAIREKKELLEKLEKEMEQGMDPDAGSEEYHPTPEESSHERTEIIDKAEDIKLKHLENARKKLKNREEEEQKEKMEKLATDLDLARKDYAQMDAKKRTMWKSIMGFYDDIKGVKEKNHVFLENGMDKAQDTDVQYMEALYLNKLLDYKNAKIAEAKEKGFSGEDLEKEMREIGKHFTVGERITVFDVRQDEAKKNMDGTIFGKAFNFYKDKVEAYKKWPNSKKRIVAGALFGAGAVASVAAGPLTAALFMGAGTGLKLFTSSAFGFDRMKASKAKADMKNTEKANSEGAQDAQNIVKEKMTVDDFSKELQNALFSADEKLQKMKSREGWANGKAVAYGVAAGATLYNLNTILEWTGLKNVAMNMFGSVAEYAHHVLERFSGVQPNISEIIEPETFTFDKGSSFEGTLIYKYLPNHLNDVLKVHPDWAGLDNGQIAHRMAIEFATQHPEMEGHLPSLVDAGSEMKIGPDLKIELTPGKYGWFEDAVNNASDNTPDTFSESPIVAPESTPYVSEYSGAEDLQPNRLADDIIAQEQIGIDGNLAGAIREDLALDRQIQEAKVASERAVPFISEGGDANLQQAFEASDLQRRLMERHNISEGMIKQLQLEKLEIGQAGTKKVLNMLIDDMKTRYGVDVVTLNSIRNVPMANLMNYQNDQNAARIPGIAKLFGNEEFRKFILAGNSNSGSAETFSKWITKESVRILKEVNSTP